MELYEVHTVTDRLESECSYFMSVFLKHSQSSDGILYFRDDGLLYLAPEQCELSFFEDILDLYFDRSACVTEAVISKVGIAEPFGFTEQGVDIILLRLGHSGEIRFHLKDTAEHILTAFSCRFACLFDLLILGKSVHDICS